jgi:hypothetical protein
MKLLMSSTLKLSIIMLLGACSSNAIDLFDGKTLDGWEVDPVDKSFHWKAEQGEIVAENPDSAGSMLWTKAVYRDYELELEYMTASEDYDTGVFPRGEGHQVQIGISRSLQRDMTACIYAPKDGKGAYPGQTDKVAEFHKIGEWNHLRIIVTGKRIQTFLNGEPFVDYEGITISDEGPIGLQLHGGVHMGVHFRDLRLRMIE